MSVLIVAELFIWTIYIYKYIQIHEIWNVFLNILLWGQFSEKSHIYSLWCSWLHNSCSVVKLTNSSLSERLWRLMDLILVFVCHFLMWAQYHLPFCTTHDWFMSRLQSLCYWGSCNGAASTELIVPFHPHLALVLVRSNITNFVCSSALVNWYIHHVADYIECLLYVLYNVLNYSPVPLLY